MVNHTGNAIAPGLGPLACRFHAYHAAFAFDLDILPGADDLRGKSDVELENGPHFQSGAGLDIDASGADVGGGPYRSSCRLLGPDGDGQRQGKALTCTGF